MAPRRENSNSSLASLAQDLQSHTFREFSIAEIRAATDNFHPSQLLGKGGFANVYRGVLPAGQSGSARAGGAAPLALAFKVLNEVPDEGSHQMVLLERELQTLLKLTHRGLVCLHGYCATKSELVLVYELAEGGTLADVIKDKEGRRFRLHLKQYLQVCQEVAEALAFLHTQGAVHRDIKPENILLTRSFEAKLADFGLLKLLDPNNEFTVTRPAGTRGYMDPEFLNSGRVSFFSDVYAFGILLLCLLTSRGPSVSKPADLELFRSIEVRAVTGGLEMGPGREAIPASERRPTAATSSSGGKGDFGPATGQGATVTRRGKGAAIGLRRWVMALHKAGELQSLLGPSFHPLLELQGVAHPKPYQESSSERMSPGPERACPIPTSKSVTNDSNRPKRGNAFVRGSSLGGDEAPCHHEVKGKGRRREVVALRSAIDLALQCSHEDPNARPQMSFVVVDLRRLVRLVRPSPSVPEFQIYSMEEINVYTSSLSTPLTSEVPPRIFCGRHPWDGQCFIVERTGSFHEGASPEQALARAKEASELQRSAPLLPLVGAHCAENEMFLIYSVPAPPEGCDSLEHLLFGTGCDFLSFSRTTWAAEERGGRAPQEVEVSSANGDAKVAKVAKGGRRGSSTVLQGMSNALARLDVRKDTKQTQTQSDADVGSRSNTTADSNPKMDGCNSDRAASLPLTVLQRCAIALNVAKSLRGLHEGGFIHGKLDPGHILLETCGAPSVHLIGHGSNVHRSRSQPEASQSSSNIDAAALEDSCPRQALLGPVSTASSSSCNNSNRSLEQTNAEGNPPNAFEDTQGDLRSLGLLLLQLATLRPTKVEDPDDLALPDSSVSSDAPRASMPLQRWAKAMLDQGAVHFLDITEHTMGQGGARTTVERSASGRASENNLHTLEALLTLGLQCLSKEVSTRPSLMEVVNRLMALKGGIEQGKDTGSRMPRPASLQRLAPRKR